MTTMPSAHKAQPDLVRAIRERAWRGDSDKEIGEALGYRKSWIGEVRRAHNIASGRKQNGQASYQEIDPAELERLREQQRREYRDRPAFGVCTRCRRLTPLANGRVPVHPAKGTMPQQRQQCPGSWLRPAALDADLPGATPLTPVTP